MSSRRAVSKLRPIDPEFWTVVNELPDPLPVSKAEIEAIESYFGELLHEVFDPTPRVVGSDQATGRCKGGKR
ncbi:MAG: hypothetical protein ACREEK_17050 [Bradyrhizobium sp.]